MKIVPKPLVIHATIRRSPTGSATRRQGSAPEAASRPTPYVAETESERERPAVEGLADQEDQGHVLDRGEGHAQEQRDHQRPDDAGPPREDETLPADGEELAQGA